ncbi:hypothetical protein CTEN210_18068 [Chaetoceros tenuissimus]|uniref:Cysteine protease n=1 Tax=Chaetoceros tenuissimus TaxID=426638 RepID=A0AAD3HF38_9STRA|nr:hypothetical protein CTEN210_18068 [Chaetoceros tenuissimus]
MNQENTEKVLEKAESLCKKKEANKTLSSHQEQDISLQQDSLNENKVYVNISTPQSSPTRANHLSPFQMISESTFGSFAKVSKETNDDSFGDEELQIVSSFQVDPEPNDNVDDQETNENITLQESATAMDDFDVCKEYGYRYEYTLEDHSQDSSSSSSSHDEEQETVQTPQGIFSKIKFTETTPSEITEKTCTDQIYILGKTYHVIHEYHARRDDEANLFWFTYRCDFLEMKPYNMTSDAGWGCMYRAAQMILGQALRMHYKDREWRADKNLLKKRQDSFMRDLLTWFADYPTARKLQWRNGAKYFVSGGESWYSLHNMVAAACARYDVLCGDWIGPTTAALVIRDILQLHSREISKSSDNSDSSDLNLFQVYVASEGTIYRSDLQDLLIAKQDAVVLENNSKQQTKADKKNSNTKTDPKYNHPLYESPVASLESEKQVPVEWDSSLLILIPLRLGLKDFDASTYRKSIAHVLSFPQSVGFIGGKPRHALWFYGATSDGSRVYGLDPHTVQRAPRRRLNISNDANVKRFHNEILFTDEYLRSIHCSKGSSMNMSRIDPSLALGFYCRDVHEFEDLHQRLKGMKQSEDFAKVPELFTIVDKKPNYDADISACMMDMMEGSSLGDNVQASNATHDVEDEYIML